VATKSYKELRNLSKDELVSKVRESELQLFNARIKKATGQLTDTASIWRTRKMLARAKTLLTRLSEAAKA
jgi:large subunit ribosomal protein L29